MPLCILAGYYGFNANILFTFKQSSELKNLSAYLTYPRFGLFVNVLVIYGCIWGEIVFSKE